MTLGLLVLAAVGFFLWVWEPWNPINAWNSRRIVRGMIMDEVEAILGKRQDMRKGAMDIEWHAGHTWILVGFNSQGRVIGHFFFIKKPLTFRHRVQTWLGWLQ